MVTPTLVHLPNGQSLTVSPIFGGMYIRSNDLSGNHHHDHCPFPPGWTVVLNTEEELEEEYNPGPGDSAHSTDKDATKTKKKIIHPYRKPTLQSDHLFISSISQPPSSEFKPASSPARQIAMMLWATLYWYFQQPEPEPYLQTPSSAKTPTTGKPKGDWRIRINREGIFKSRVILPKLERMGLIASLDSAVGVDRDERAGEGWLEMFVSRRSYWQLDARIYLFTLAPGPGSPAFGGTPVGSRPGSPTRQSEEKRDNSIAANVGSGLLSGSASPGPFHSTSHLPTYYPPPPPFFTYTNGVRHPVRPKPGKQGEVVYTRYIPSVGQYLSFRIASMTPHPTATKPPVSSMSIIGGKISLSDSALPTVHSLGLEDNDVEILHKWMNEPRVSRFWGEHGPISRQETLLKNALRSKHSIPLIGCWDGKPFGYFELYWVKEDPLGRLLGDTGNYDRGIHCLVGEQEFRGPHRVKIWLSSLVHYCWLADNRTDVVMMEPRVDNEK
jgi:N5-hydroxyornithine acetyltransferase